MILVFWKNSNDSKWRVWKILFTCLQVGVKRMFILAINLYFSKHREFRDISIPRTNILNGIQDFCRCVTRFLLKQKKLLVGVNRRKIVILQCNSWLDQIEGFNETSPPPQEIIWPEIIWKSKNKKVYIPN